MNNKEKAELLKQTIYQLYVKENRSKSYISRLLQIPRTIIRSKIHEWNFPEPEPKRHLSPSNQKFVNKHREKIVSLLNENKSITEIAKTLHISRDKLSAFLKTDAVLNKHFCEYKQRLNNKTAQRIEEIKTKSSRNYDFTEIEGEEWRDILGYKGYQVSNFGRVRRYAERYKSYYLLTLTPNKNNGRPYVSMTHDSGKRKNLITSRLVGFAFLEGHSKEKNTINHKNGDVTDCRAENLEWVSQSENNLHAYVELGRSGTYGNQYRNQFTGKEFVVNGNMTFKTVKELALFLNKSETQTRRYLNAPEKKGIVIRDSE